MCGTAPQVKRMAIRHRAIAFSLPESGNARGAITKNSA